MDRTESKRGSAKDPNKTSLTRLSKCGQEMGGCEEGNASCEVASEKDLGTRKKERGRTGSQGSNRDHEQKHYRKLFGGGAG